MSFHTVDYVSGHHELSQSSFQSDIENRDMIRFRDINRVSSQSLWQCLFEGKVDYIPANKNLRRLPIQKMPSPFFESHCIEKLPLAGVLNYPKIKKICDIVFYTLAFSGFAAIPIVRPIIAIHLLIVSIAAKIFPLIARKSVLSTPYLLK